MEKTVESMGWVTDLSRHYLRPEGFNLFQSPWANRDTEAFMATYNLANILHFALSPRPTRR
jgi:hypothetical protein